MEILKCEGVKKVYGSGGSQVEALKGIDLSVKKGEFVAITGASGSGEIHPYAYSWQCGFAHRGKGHDRRDGYCPVKPDPGGDFQAEEGGAYLSVL